MAPEKAPEVLAFLQKHSFDFEHIPDADDFLKRFGVGFPKNILVDKKGVVRYIGLGLVEESTSGAATETLGDRQLRQLIEELLAE